MFKLSTVITLLSFLSVLDGVQAQGFRGGNRGGGAGNANPAASTGGTAASTSSTSSTGSTAGTGSTGNTGLDQSVIQSASTSNGNPSAGQSASLTDSENFINFCAGKTLTNGQQLTGGSCNGIVMGDIPSKANMVSAIILNPAVGKTIPANTPFNIQVQVQNLVAGVFTNPDITYYAAPQQLQGGKVVGHCHVVVQKMQTFNDATPPDPTTFQFFKGIDDAGNGQGLLQAAVTTGLPAGIYRVCTLMGSSNHQPVLMPVAQRGPQDDCTKFEVTAGGAAGTGNTGSSLGSGNAGGVAAAAGGASATTAVNFGTAAAASTAAAGTAGFNGGNSANFGSTNAGAAATTSVNGGAFGNAGTSVAAASATATAGFAGGNGGATTQAATAASSAAFGQPSDAGHHHGDKDRNGNSAAAGASAAATGGANLIHDHNHGGMAASQTSQGVAAAAATAPASAGAAMMGDQHNHGGRNGGQRLGRKRRHVVTPGVPMPRFQARELIV